MNTETAMELQMRIAKEAVAMLVTRPTLDVQQYKESILLIGEAWGVSATDTLKLLDLIGQELLALQAMREGKKAEHVLPESELPMWATGTETLDNIWDLFETSLHLDSMEKRMALFQMAHTLEEAQNMQDWIKLTDKEQKV